MQGIHARKCGIVVCALDFLMHGMIMAIAYTKYIVFRQAQANPLWFLVEAIVTELISGTKKKRDW